MLADLSALDPSWVGNVFFEGNDPFFTLPFPSLPLPSPFIFICCCIGLPFSLRSSHLPARGAPVCVQPLASSAS